MKRLAIFALSAMLLVACDKKPGDNAAETTSEALEPETTVEPETTAEVEPEPEPEPELTPEQIEAREKPFGTFVEGADLVKVGRSHFEPGSEPGASRSGVTKDPDVIASLVAAVGKETMTDDVPSRCKPTHYIAFFKGEDKLRSFKFWCEESDDVAALYIEDRQFTSVDPKTAGKMINGILDGTYAE
jgi:hypothetical protein